MSFEEGDVVRVKSGGPSMTVEKVAEKSMTGEIAVWCVWFDMVGNKQVPQEGTFSPAVLVKVEQRTVVHAPRSSIGSAWSA